MDIIIKAAETMQIKESVLDKLLMEKEKLNQKIEGLQMILHMALSSVASGDNSKSKEINDLVNQMAPLRFKMEGLLFLISEANEDVQEARMALDQAKEEHRRAQTLYESQ